PAQHRWFFAMLKKVVDNTDRWEGVEPLRDALKFSTGNYRLTRDLQGRWREVPNSMSYASMKEIEFKMFVLRCLDLIQEHLGIDAEQLMREVDAEEGWSPSSITSDSEGDPDELATRKQEGAAGAADA